MKYDFQNFSIDLSEAVEIERFDDRPHYYGVIFKENNKFSPPPGPTECRHRMGCCDPYARSCGDCYGSVDGSAKCPHRKIVKSYPKWNCLHCDGEGELPKIFQYQIIHNLYMGYRLLISDGEGYVRDIPFNKWTAGMLPKGINIQWK